MTQLPPKNKKMICKYPVNKRTTVNGNQFDYVHPCGRCIGCMINRRDEWAGRIMLENSLHPASVFLTLTLSEEALEEHGPNLNKKVLQKYIKSVRMALNRLDKRQIRYYACGEYGDEFGRPHYHAVIFNYSIEEEPCHYGSKGETIWTGTLSQKWNKGFITLSQLTPYLARYVAKYTVKHKMLLESLHNYDVMPFGIMSRKPALGAGALPAIAASLSHHVHSLSSSLSTDNLTSLNDYMFNGYINIARRSYPLGRTLSTKLSELLSVSPKTKLSQYLQMEMKADKHDHLRDIPQLIKLDKMEKSLTINLPSKDW